MGNLTKTTLDLDLKKAVISIWFRIPTEAAEIVLARGNTGAGFAVLDTVLPLLTFGAQQQGRIYNVTGVDAGECPPTVHHFGSVEGDSYLYPESPSCIGVQYNDIDGSSAGQLFVHIQTADNPVLVNIQQLDPTGSCSGPPSFIFTFDSVDGSYIFQSQHDYIAGSARRGALAGGWDVTPDEWHHALISWDLGAGNSAHGADNDVGGVIDTTSTMWCGFDDVNRNGLGLPSNWVGNVTGDSLGDPNAVLSAGAARAIGLGGTHVFGTPTASVTFTSVPTSPISIPGPLTLDRATDFLGNDETFDANQLVEMAELQIFSGVTLDTSVLENRRAFVTETGTPAAASLASALLGKAPEVYFHGHTNFKNGTNLGTIGAFTPTGTINPFTPGPSLA